MTPKLMIVCQVGVLTTTPDADAVDVPIDTLPAATVGWCDDEQASLHAELYQGEDLVFEQRFDFDGHTVGLAEAGVELQPETAYTWILTPAGDEETVVAFTTGTEPADLDGAASSLVVTNERWDPFDKTGFLGVEVIPPASPEGDLAVVEVLDEQGEVLDRGVQWDPSGSVFLSLDFEGERPEDLCVTPAHRRIDGSWIEGEAHCEERLEGCSTTGGAVALLPALLTLFGLRRRR